MPIKQWTAAHRAAASKRMKAAWRRRRKQQRLSPGTGDVAMLNGSLVEQRIILHVQNQTLDLTMPDAKALRDALNLVVPTTE